MQSPEQTLRGFAYDAILSKSGRHAASSITAASANASAVSRYRLRSRNTIIRSFLTPIPPRAFATVYAGADRNSREIRIMPR